MRLGIVGSRTFNDYDEFTTAMSLIEIWDCEEIVSGGASGADTLAEKYANQHKIPTKIFKPDWTKYGKKAGFIRNQDIVENSDFLIAFWDGSSKGTKNSIDLAIKTKKPILIYNF
jgi:hypothetical protein